VLYLILAIPRYGEDAVTGIGRRTDSELARVLRYGVRADGRAAFPLMEFELSDEDRASISARRFPARRCRGAPSRA